MFSSEWYSSLSSIQKFWKKNIFKFLTQNFIKVEDWDCDRDGTSKGVAMEGGGAEGTFFSFTPKN